MSDAARGGGRAAPPLLRKLKSWSPDAEREAAWERRSAEGARGRASSVTDDDLEELRGCFELGFGFEAGRDGAARSRLAETLPALDLYFAVHRRGDEEPDMDATSEESPNGSPSVSILSTGDPPEIVKARLKQWAQVVAWSVHDTGQSSSFKIE